MDGAGTARRRLHRRAILSDTMIIHMRKFGTVLNARPAGRESLLAIRPTLPPMLSANQPPLNLSDARTSEQIELDFEGVEVLTPSFAEEFIIHLLDQYPGHVQFRNTGNVTVRTTLDFLARQWPNLTSALSAHP